MTPALPSLRTAGPAVLAAALQASRHDTLATFAAFERALPGLQVPQRATLNPPLWELGHIGWFQAWWLSRNPQQAAGLQADPDAPRSPPARPGADALYDSARVAHARRWSLPLPDADATRADLARDLALHLAMLQHAADDDTALYFHRLVLLHEDMHHEAALYMAQALGVPITDARWQPPLLPQPRETLVLPAGEWRLGHAGDGGFAFDNELCAHAVPLGPTDIDSRVLTWAEYLPFVQAGGYRQPHLWTKAGRAWLAETGAQAPRYLRREGDDWQAWRQGDWRPLALQGPACHLTAFEAEAWCRWAGRRLPTEAEWERAAAQAPGFEWGAVWEWTASPFEPYPGFAPHPYREYSQPWFGSRRVLRGASFLTQPRLHDLRYRNFFPPDRNDVPAGLRSCAA